MDGLKNFQLSLWLGEYRGNEVTFVGLLDKVEIKFKILVQHFKKNIKKKKKVKLYNILDLKKKKKGEKSSWRVSFGQSLRKNEAFVSPYH